jgi:hypothetical protein
MKGIGRMAAAAAALAAALAGCASKPAEAPEPPPARPSPPPPPPPQSARPAPPPPASWADAPLSPGGWSYRAEASGSEAWFGPAAGEPAFVMRCDRARRQIRLARSGDAGDYLMRITTSTGTAQLRVELERQPRLAVAAPLAASDTQLDAIAFSRGRFMVEVPGAQRLIMPSWPETARVIEDCRS